MNAREKFLASMSFEPGAPVLKWEYGYWAGAVRRWQREGLGVQQPIPESLGDGESVRAEGMGDKPSGFNDRAIHDLFGMDAGFRRVPLENFLDPPFPIEILEDHGDWVLRRNNMGILSRQRKDRATPEALLAGPVQNHQDWEKIKGERLQPNFEARLPANWSELVRAYRERDYPLILGGGQGFYGSPRYLVGDQRLLTLYYDDPKLILDINEHLCNLWIALYERVLEDITVDAALIWEDMCYKNGPLISPAMFERFMLPFYKRLTGLFRDYNIRVIFVDTDGNAWRLIPSFLQGGVTGLFPFEASAGMDVRQVRMAFPRLHMLGGVDKMKLIQGSQAIDEELDQKISPLLREGGYIPTVDHLVPPDVSWESFKYYRQRLNALIDDA